MGVSTNNSCLGTSYSTSVIEDIPTNNTFALVTYQSQSNLTLEQQPRYQGLQQCCGPDHPVSKLSYDCVLWCDLPQEMVDNQTEFFDCFRGTKGAGFASVVNGSNAPGDEGSGAQRIRGRTPGVLGTSVLALMVGWFCLVA
ncbi:uncharacterized protein F4822DRAFT_162596 [Hypoxylon trugodes]|uniref:uncharacterized protein n=1 Tax=Hypoxylon trugodes TaxID=326681 RepID=UPI00218F577D|nr:uncharacterized protein F4822DRAFT_162596 [Hypoxylon trugodes]KAI1390743.1 hypothetical protein F4822DRAFT_162596 [Hypoxylon trugodes]